MKGNKDRKDRRGIRACLNRLTLPLLSVLVFVSMAGCGFSGSENLEKIALALDKAQSLADEGKLEEAVEMILDHPSSDPFLKGRANWMLTDMLGLTNSGIREELMPVKRIALTEDEDRWEMLSISPAGKYAMVQIGSSVSDNEIRIIDLENGQITGSLGAAADSGSENTAENHNENTYEGGIFLSDQKIALWKNMEISLWDTDNLSEPVCRQTLEMKTGLADENSSQNPMDNVYQKILEVRAAENKLFVLMNHGALMLNGENLEPENQAYSEMIDFGFSPFWTIRDEKAAVAVSSEGLFSTGLEDEKSQRKGLFVIDFQKENPQIELLTDQPVCAAFWGQDGSLYAGQFSDPLFDSLDESEKSVFLKKYNYRLYRYENGTLKAQSAPFRLMNNQSAVPIAEAGYKEFGIEKRIAFAAGNEIVYLDASTLQTVGSTAVANPVTDLWSSENGLTVSEQEGMLEKLTGPVQSPVTEYSDPSVTKFVRSEQGEFAAVWKDGLSEGIEALKKKGSAHRTVLDAEHQIIQAEYLKDPASENLMRLIAERSLQTDSEGHQEQTYRCIVGVSGSSDLIWEKEFTVSNRPFDDFGYETELRGDPMSPAFALASDGEQLYIDSVTPQGVSRIYLSSPDQEILTPAKEQIICAAISPLTGKAAVSSKDGIDVLVFDEQKKEFVSENHYERKEPWTWVQWSADGKILAAADTDEISFLNTETGKWVVPGDDEGAVSDGQYKIYGYNGLVSPAVLGKKKNYTMFEVQDNNTSERMIWVADMDSGKIISDIPMEDADGKSVKDFVVQWSDFISDDSQIALSNGSGSVFIWSLSKQKMIDDEALQNFQKHPGGLTSLRAHEDWLDLISSGTIGYSLSEGSLTDQRDLYRMENGKLIPWMSVQGADYIFPEEQRALIQDRRQTVEIVLPDEEEVLKAARAYIENRKAEEIDDEA